MWKAIADDIKNILNIIKNEEQCENRYKTILKRKKKRLKIIQHLVPQEKKCRMKKS